jgi:hypothetical protein
MASTFLSLYKIINYTKIILYNNKKIEKKKVENNIKKVENKNNKMKKSISLQNIKTIEYQ